MLNIYRQGVSIYVKNFVEVGISKPLYGKTSPGLILYLSKEDQNKFSKKF